MNLHTDPVSLVLANAAGYFALSALLDGGPITALLFAVVGVAVLTRRHVSAMGSP